MLRTAFFIVAVGSAVGCPSTTSSGSSGLVLSAATGAAPLAVVVTAPEKVAGHPDALFSPRGGCGFEIDWGDRALSAPPGATKCGAFLSHTYTKPGTYVVRASTYRILPTDGRETDWNDETTVVVK